MPRSSSYSAPGVGFRGYIGIMEKKMETTRIGFIGYIMGLYWDNGKENGNYYSILGFGV